MPSGSPRRPPRRWTAVTGEAPAALWSKDYHSLWLNSAALALARGDLEVEGGVVERGHDGEPTGVLREESAWRFRERYVTVTQDEWVEATRRGIRLAHSRGVGAIHDKDGWLGAPGIFQRIAAEGGLTLRVWQSLPHERVGELAALGLRSRIGDDFLRIGYLKCFMDGTLGSQTAWMLDGSGVQITSGEELAEIVRAGASAGWPVAVHAIGDRANREALDAFESTRDEWAAARAAAADRACAVPRAGGRRPLRRARRRVLGAVLARAVRPRPRRALLGRPARGDLRLPVAAGLGRLVANGSDAPVEELDPIAGLAAGVLRTIDERPAWRPEQALTVEQALRAATVNAAWLAGDERRRGKLLPGYLADLVVLDRDPLTVDAEELPSLQVVATMVGGRWVHNPPPWELGRS